MNIEVVRFALLSISSVFLVCFQTQSNERERGEKKRGERERPKIVGPGGLWLSSDSEGFVLGLRQG